MYFTYILPLVFALFSVLIFLSPPRNDMGFKIYSAK